MAVKNSKKLGFAETQKARVFELTDEDFTIRLSKFKMAAKVWWLKIPKKLKFSSKLQYSGVRGR